MACAHQRGIYALCRNWTNPLISPNGIRPRCHRLLTHPFHRVFSRCPPGINGADIRNHRRRPSNKFSGNSNFAQVLSGSHRRPYETRQHFENDIAPARYAKSFWFRSVPLDFLLSYCLGQSSQKTNVSTFTYCRFTTIRADFCSFITA